MDITIFDPRFDQLVDTRQEIQTIVTGFKFVEGPIWHPLERCLIFSDILGNSIYRWTAALGVKTIRRNSYLANGNTYDRQGRVVTCEHATSRLTRTNFAVSDESEVLATHYQGKQLNSPNDVICNRAGQVASRRPRVKPRPASPASSSERLAGSGIPVASPSEST